VTMRTVGQAPPYGSRLDEDRGKQTKREDVTAQPRLSPGRSLGFVGWGLPHRFHLKRRAAMFVVVGRDRAILGAQRECRPQRRMPGPGRVIVGRMRRILRWMIFSIGGVVGLLALAVLLGPTIRGWQMGLAIARFEKRPTESRAESLVELLQAHAGTDEQGNRALALLLRPNIVTRKSYAMGRLVTIAIERRFKLGFRSFQWKDESISVNGHPSIRYHGSGSLDHGIACLNVPGFYTQPGIYPVELSIHCSLGVERVSRGTALLRYLHDGLPWLVPEPAWQPARAYICDFTASSQVTVVAEGEAEKIKLVSSAQLDQSMRAAFSSRYLGIETGYSTPTGGRRVRGSAEICYENLPVAAAFSMIVRLPDGREIPQKGLWPRELFARAGRSGSFKLDPSKLASETPGRHTATLVLVPDPNLAYTDPAIKAIWNGTLEFPISFFVDANPPSR